MSIGGLDGDSRYELFNVQSAVRLVEGTIVVANQGSSEIRFYDSAGRHRRSVGRKGGGPGEFGYLGWLELWGDTIVAFDRNALRLTFYTTTGELLGTDRLRPTDDVPYPWPVGVFDDRTMLVIGPWKDVPSGRGIWRDARSFYRYDMHDATALRIGLEYQQTQFRERFGSGGLLSIPIPFGPTQEVRVHGRSIFEIRSDEFQILIRDQTGRLTTVVRKQHEPQPVSADELELAKERLHTRSRHQAIRDAVRASYSDMPIPFLAPALGLRAWERVPSDFAPKSSIMIDDMGNIWVLEFNRLAVQNDQWTVFDPSGVLVGTLEFPARFQPLHIGNDYILGLARNQDEVEYVRVYGLDKEAPRGDP